ncbi:MAG: acetyl-CoA carboxylase carboxyltransferase subunit, partial [Myxococcales bacterium]|nr:acetyl-CoA carboxylase carboxyltransferase subunit [Myxococcales bacterium]
MPEKDIVTPTLRNPLGVDRDDRSPAPKHADGPYEASVREGERLRERPRTAAGLVQIGRQHAKDRMTVWERIEVLR